MWQNKMPSLTLKIFDKIEDNNFYKGLICWDFMGKKIEIEVYEMMAFGRSFSGYRFEGKSYVGKLNGEEILKKKFRAFKKEILNKLQTKYLNGLEGKEILIKTKGGPEITKLENIARLVESPLKAPQIKNLSDYLEKNK
jgi:hypothetical protein